MQARAGSAGQLLAMLRELALKGSREWTSTEVTLASGGSPATVRRHLNLLCQQGHLGREGLARATRYRLLAVEAREPVPAPYEVIEKRGALGVTPEGHAAAHRQWQEDHREFIAAYNEVLESEGLPLSEWRTY